MNDQPAGMRATRSRAATTWGPKPGSNMPSTRSPGARSSTSGPTSSTMPAPSLPIRAAGSGYMPSAMSTSRKFTPVARTATRTWPEASSVAGAGTSATPSSVPGATGARCQRPAAGGVSSSSGRRVNRGTRTPSPRRASCPPVGVGSAATPDSTASTSPSGARSRSASTTRPGCSDCADRSRPHTAAPARSSTRSPSRAATAPRLTTTSRESPRTSAASHACTTASTSAVTDRTRSGTSPSARSGPMTGSSTASGAGMPPATAAASAATSG
ncbi:hypothetical protein B0E53_06536 [Micromonospora sp. MH33]|nr:hypothetical protein B0E53_06536 [Micromonospora sp. MH33]